MLWVWYPYICLSKHWRILIAVQQKVEISTWQNSSLSYKPIISRDQNSTEEDRCGMENMELCTSSAIISVSNGSHVALSEHLLSLSFLSVSVCSSVHGKAEKHKERTSAVSRSSSWRPGHVLVWPRLRAQRNDDQVHLLSQRQLDWKQHSTLPSRYIFIFLLHCRQWRVTTKFNRLPPQRL